MREAVKEGSVETLYSARAGRRLAYIQPSMTKVQRLSVTCVGLLDDDRSGARLCVASEVRVSMALWKGLEHSGPVVQVGL